ncbi:hypothetical protein ACHAWF_018155 [Thalassiosira exigua]
MSFTLYENQFQYHCLAMGVFLGRGYLGASLLSPRPGADFFSLPFHPTTKVEKARSELAKSPQVKERRDQALATRREGLEADLAARAEHARARSQRHLAEKQRRASRQERRGRAERRRALDVYERRARLLGALDARLEGAAVRSREIVEEKAAKAGEDVDKAKEVARRVRAARAIQRAARDAYGLEGPDVVGEGSAPSQREAARRLRRWLPWRARACARRLRASEGGDGDSGGDGEPARAIDALERLLGLFPLASAGGRRRPSSPPTFDELGRRMMRPDTLKMASAVVWALRPINEASFASDEGPCPKMDGRTLLSLLLIAVHPREVLGEDCDIPSSGSGEDAKDDKAKHDKSGAGSRLLAVKSRALVEALNDLLGDGQDLPTEVLVQISSLCLETVALFAWWKDLDLRRLLAGLSRQLEQSWVVYLSSSETLRYLTEATGVDPTTAREAKDKQRRDDPLMSLRIRHEAGRSGSRSHIKRVRLSLNKLVGMDEAKDVVKSAKAAALKEMEEAGTMKDLKGEIDEICGRLGLTSSQDLSEGSEVPESENGPAGIDRDAENSEQSGQLEDLPQEILTNRLLVHRILVTDPADFEKLSWDGSDARSPNSTPEEFMASIDAVTSEDSNDVAPSMEDMSSRIAQTMRLAFFRKIADEMKGGDFQSIQELLMELHAKMRSLLPSRKDLHSHVNDESVASCHSVSDILRALVSIGYLLAGYLESAARAPTTRELIGCLEAFVSRPCDEGGLGVPYGIETKELFVVTSAGYLLQKAELCQFDLANYKLSRAAPLLHLMGHEYERRNFRELCGDYTTSSVVGLKDILPSTWTWVQRSQDQFGESDRLTMQSGLEHKMDFIMGRGFVDGILFTQSQLALPEVLSLDAEGIEHVRRKAQRCVIASALALHAGNISRVGTSSLAPTDAVDNARQALSLALERMYNRQEELETNVIKAVSALTTVLAEKDLTMDENAALKNHTLAVIRGEDPVLKLLDNRVRSFFRFACRWRPDSSNTGAVAPSKMKTGRPMFSTGDSASVPQSTKGEFMKAARRETSRLGFSHFGHDLVEAAHDARLIATLLCVNYGKDILSRFLSMACESV